MVDHCWHRGWGLETCCFCGRVRALVAGVFADGHGPHSPENRIPVACDGGCETRQAYLDAQHRRVERETCSE